MARSPARRQKKQASPESLRRAGDNGCAAAGGISRKNGRLPVFNNLPAPFPNNKSELALWRAFLGEEIDAILRDEE